MKPRLLRLSALLAGAGLALLLAAVLWHNRQIGRASCRERVSLNV